MPNNEPKKDKQQGNELPNIWDILKERKQKGLWHGDIDVVKIKEYKINSGAHYFVIEDLKKGSVACTSCPIKHGGYLEPHLLTRYEVKDGVIYLDGKAMTQRAS